MNPIPGKTLERANEAAVYNVYLYLADKSTPGEHESLRSIVAGLEAAMRRREPQDWKDRDRYRLGVLGKAVDRWPPLGDSRIGDLTRSKSGLTACSFTNSAGDVHVVFKGTGSGEWLDNGEGLSGIAEENTYITYGKSGKPIFRTTVSRDHATDQQVEALNWFYSIAARNGWGIHTGITLSGHSKGGNKAQFVAIHSDLVKDCFSFDGQGFSPEALAALKGRYGAKFEARRRHIWSFAADNDYVNVLGERLMPEHQICYFESARGFHYMEAMLDGDGRFRSPCEQGKLSMYVERLSKELMNVRPFARKYATLGVMGVFQKYLGGGAPSTGDAASVERLVAALGAVIDPLLHDLLR